MRFKAALANLLILVTPVMAVCQEVLKGNFWKNQALEEVIPHWRNHVFDEEDGGFHTYLRRDWQPYQSEHQYPGMISRQLFSFSVAYMLSGNQAYLQDAEKTLDYMIKHGWDAKYGGWYDELDDTGAVVKPTKDLFMQIYAITGLTMYYAATRDAKALNYIHQSYQILQEHAWDAENGGYYRKLNRDLTVANPQKDFSPQLAPISGFLTYLYPITRDNQYLMQMEAIMKVAMNQMRHPEEKWIMESFTKEWQPIEGANEYLNVGHNAEFVWLMLRLYHMTGKASYQDRALELHPKLSQYAFNEKTGAWYHNLKIADPGQNDGNASWWVQAYGNMLQLYLYRITGDDQFLSNFQQGAQFWNQAFLDDAYGGTLLKTDLKGKVTKGAKGVRTKTAYHSMEHGFLNYLYLRLWVENQPATLYYHLTNTEEGATFHPSPLVDPEITIREVRINGTPWEAFNPEQQSITLPKADEAKIKVVFE